MAPRGMAILAAALVATAAPVVRADDAGEYTFTVLKDGSPVGQHRFEFDRDGERDLGDLPRRPDRLDHQ